jgi:heme a synthase
LNTNKTALIELWYRRIARVSVGAVLFLILVGGIVRSTGSGMGCPDWPKCFGVWVPPTTLEEIPTAFFENVKYKDYQTKSFNAFQTWTEYVNRLIGATTGLLMLATALLSLGFWKRDRRIVFLSFAALFFTLFEGWLGKLVVDRNLAGGMVTIHLLGAMLIMVLLILANYLVAARLRRTGAYAQSGTRKLAWLGAIVIALTLAQLLIGTQVREGVDEMAKLLGSMKRDGWLAPSLVYSIHKVLWLVLVAAMAVWLKQLLAELGDNRTVKWLAVSLMALMVGEVIFGTVLAYFELPPYIQPLHMLFANLIFAAEFSIWIHGLGIQRLFSKGMKDNTLQGGAIVDAK